MTYLDTTLKERAREQAAFMKLVLTKPQTTLQERTTARTLQAELLLPDDEVDANHVYRLAAPTQAGALNAIAA